MNQTQFCSGCIQNQSAAASLPSNCKDCSKSISADLLLCTSCAEKKQLCCKCAKPLDGKQVPEMIGPCGWGC